MKKGKPAKGNNARFYKAVLALDSEKACKMFFEDILTEAEMLAITQRLQIASMLNSGDLRGDQQGHRSVQRHDHKDQSDAEKREQRFQIRSRQNRGIIIDDTR